MRRAVRRIGRVAGGVGLLVASSLAAAQYRVYPVPVEAPTFTSPAPPADARVLLIDPAGTASPFGWHDVDGIAGAEFTIMRGNNVHAYDDIDANNLPPAVEPDCGPLLECDFPIDLTLPPSAWVPASVANLFYWNNAIHDITALYGFDSVGGNFQVNTYGLGGLGGDDVRAETQEGIGTNGGTFSTPPDGTQPRMQMFVWTLTTPNRDGSLDAGVITHEYGHGISARLVGGPGNVSCLSSAEAPVEGLSDVYALLLTSPAANPAVRGIATYLIGQPPTGAGIRSQRFDKTPEPNSNSWTYASITGAPNPHAVGEKWAQLVWYLSGRLEDAHGFDPDLYGFTGSSSDAGNVRALYYTIEGLKVTACSPGFVDARNGILAAATSAYGGEDVCLLWEAFAEFGLGFSASQGSSNSVNDQVPAFDIPAACSPGDAGGDARVCAGSDHVQDVLVGPAFTAPVTLSAAGNPAPTTTGWSENPVSGPLPETVQLTIGNTAAAPAGTSTLIVSGDDGAPRAIGSFDLTIDAAAPGQPGLVAPADGSTGQPLRPTFTWTAVGAASEYLLEIDDDADFASPVYAASVTGTSHEPSSNLPAFVPLFWRVTAANGCGPGLPSPLFQLIASPYGSPVEECFEVDLPIPDGQPSGVTDARSVAFAAAVSDVDLRIVLEPDHTWAGDTTFRLTLGTTTVTVVDRPGWSGSGFGCSANLDDVTLDDEASTPIESPPGCTTTSSVITGDFVPNEGLAELDGLDSGGPWTLFASDSFTGDTGTIDRWCLIYTLVDPMPFLDGFESGDTSQWSASVP